MLHTKRKLRLHKAILLPINLIAIIGLTGSIFASQVPPSTIPLFSILALIYPILLLTNLGFVFIWLVLKDKLFLLSLIVVLLGYPIFLNNFQLNSVSESKKDANSVKALSYNVQLFGLIENKPETEQKRNRIIEFINNENADIICLQEYYSEGITPYAPLEDLKTELNTITYYYESYFSPRHNQLTGLILFSKYPATGKGKLKFEGTRTFGIYTDLLIKEDTVRVYNIHLASIQLLPEDIDFVVNAGQDQSEGRLEKAFGIYSKLKDAFLLRQKQMVYLLEQLNDCKYPVILCGDFNDTPSSYVYNQVTNELEDAYRSKGNGLSKTYAGQIPMLRIDYILTSDYFETLEYSRYKINYSDHFPISATLQIRN